MIKRVVLGLAAMLFAAASAAAVSVLDRSPFAQGHWWDPTRSGHGFDIFNAGGQVAVMWFTYDDAGKPTWYTAQGDDKSVGTAWPLLKHRWADGRKAGYTTVGTLKLEINHPESMKVTWQLGAQSGSWNIEPFRASGMVGEIDHTGSWFDPANSGWGIAIVQQGEVLGGAIFTYDANGDPTWLAGFERNASSAQFYTAKGTCPGCPYSSPTLTSMGRVSFDFTSEREAVVHNGLTLPMAAGVNMDGAKIVQLGRPASTRAADRQLAYYDSEGPMRDYLVAGMLNVQSYVGGGTDFSAAPPPSSYSTTNLVESGVDEPDLIKSDGRYVYSFAAGVGIYPAPAIRVARVDDEASGLAVVGSVPLASGANTPTNTAGLFLYNGALVSITGTQPYSGISPWATSGAWRGGSTYVEVIDVSTPEHPASKWRAKVDGQLISARRIGNRLYLVTRFVPDIANFVYGANGGSLLDRNRQLLAATPTSALLPSVSINGGTASPLVSANHVFAPAQGARPPVADMVAVSAIDLTTLRIAQSIAIVGAADAVYVSQNNLYLTSSRFNLRTPTGGLLPEPVLYLSDVNQVRLGDNTLDVVGSGTVEGYLASDAETAQFRMSEFQGRLRVVTGSAAMWGPNKNRLTILEPSTVAPGVLRTVSYLPNANRPDPLGKPGELLYATRFVGERLYAVTFKMIDPLYIVDLVDVSDPHVTGSVVMPGFAQYLHPLPNGLLLGFGKDAVPALDFGDGSFAWYQGLLLSLYDVSNASAPKEVQRIVLGKRGSDSILLRDHHAFSSLLDGNGAGIIAFPASLNDGPATSNPPPNQYYPWQQSGLMRFALNGTTAANMRLTALLPLITYSASTAPMYFNDGARLNARSVLFGAGSVYLSNGQLWRQDRNGQQSGPY